eukprot:4745063-Amphidinium_carterae.4
MWLARQCRPDVQGVAAVLARNLGAPAGSDQLETQKAVQYILQKKGLGIYLSGIHPRDMRITKSLKQGVEAVCNVVNWRSGKLDRVCNSSMAAEAYSTVGGLATAEWVMQCLGEVCNSAWIHIGRSES